MQFLAPELASITGITAATILIMNDKPWWTWLPFFLFACVYAVTGYGEKKK